VEEEMKLFAWFIVVVVCIWGTCYGWDKMADWAKVAAAMTIGAIFIFAVISSDERVK
jgi:hypothetical protein